MLVCRHTNRCSRPGRKPRPRSPSTGVPVTWPPPAATQLSSCSASPQAATGQPPHSASATLPTIWTGNRAEGQALKALQEFHPREAILQEMISMETIPRKLPKDLIIKGTVQIRTLEALELLCGKAWGSCRVGRMQGSCREG